MLLLVKILKEVGYVNLPFCNKKRWIYKARCYNSFNKYSLTVDSPSILYYESRMLIEEMYNLVPSDVEG